MNDSPTAIHHAGYLAGRESMKEELAAAKVWEGLWAEAQLTLVDVRAELAAAKAALTRIKTWARCRDGKHDQATGYDQARRWVLILAEGEK